MTCRLMAQDLGLEGWLRYRVNGLTVGYRVQGSTGFRV